MNFERKCFDTQEMDFREGESIMRMGDEASHISIVKEGNVCVEEDYLQQSHDESLVPFPEGLITERPNRWGLLRTTGS